MDLDDLVNAAKLLVFIFSNCFRYTCILQWCIRNIGIVSPTPRHNMEDCEQNIGKRPHITKDQRVPRSYKEVEKVLIAVKSCQGNIKTVMYNSRLRGPVFNKVYALAVNVLQYRSLLEKIVEDIELLKKENIRKEMAGIMIYEMIFGKGLPGDSKPVQMMMKHQDGIFKSYMKLKDESESLTGLYSLPKYVRINTLKTSQSAVLKDLEDWEYQQIFYEDSASFDEYLDLVKNLQISSFLIDYHFKDLLVFSSKENLSKWPLYQKGHVFIQDKSSYLPVHALDPKPGSTVLDVCAAPGMKTIHIASLMQNSGKIYAFEKDQKRFEILKDMLDTADVKTCSPTCKDFSLVKSDNPMYNSVECILVDPSCSGSGMVNRMDEVTDTENSKNKLRLQKLSGFQILLLKHALSFPSVKRVVYSTCSITEEENEFVVHEVLHHYRNRFKLVPVMPHWPIRGFEHFEFGTLCLRAFPEKSLTNGFFVAMFERLNSEEQQELYQNSFAGSKNSRKDRYKKKFKSEHLGNSHHSKYSSQERNLEFGKEEPYSENIVYHHNGLPEIKSKKKFNSKFQKDSQNFENSTPFQDLVTDDIKVKENGEPFSCETENIEETSANNENLNEKEKIKRKKHKKKHNSKDEGESFNEISELHSELCSSEPTTISDKKKHSKKKQCNNDADVIEESVENGEVKKVKHKKSKRAKLEDMETYQPMVIEDVMHPEGEKKRKKAKKSHHLNEAENNKSYIELDNEIVQEDQEFQKKKHKKKCKDKKHKGD